MRFWVTRPFNFQSRPPLRLRHPRAASPLFERAGPGSAFPCADGPRASWRPSSPGDHLDRDRQHLRLDKARRKSFDQVREQPSRKEWLLSAIARPFFSKTDFFNDVEVDLWSGRLDALVGQVAFGRLLAFA